MAGSDDDPWHPPSSFESAGSTPASLCAACCRGSTRIGNTVTLWGASSRRRRFPSVCVVGPDWPCNLCSWGLIVGLTLAFLTLVAPSVHWGIGLADALTGAALMWALAVTAFSDAGYLPRQTPEQLEAQKVALTDGEGAGHDTVTVTPPAALGGGGFSDAAPVLVAGGAAAAAVVAAVSSTGTVVDHAAARQAGEDEDSGGEDAGVASPALPPPPPPPPMPRTLTVCSTCRVLRERGTSHCYDCDRCVADLDHHCPWTGKCIGKGNIGPFRAFLGALCVHAAFTAIAVVAVVVTRSGQL